MRRLKLLSLVLLIGGLGVALGWAATARASKTSTRTLIFFEPGSAWDYGSPLRRQSGFSKHVVYFRKVFKERKVTMVGTVKGKKLILVLGPQGASKADLKAIAEGDPLVKARVLKYDLREWTLDFEGDESNDEEEEELSDVDLEGY